MKKNPTTDNVENVLSEINTLLSALDTQVHKSELPERVVQALETTKARLVEISADVKNKAQQLAQSTDSYVRGRPWQAVGTAAAAGLLIGVLSARR